MRSVTVGIVTVMVLLSAGLARASAMQAPAPPDKPAAAKVDAAPVLTEMQKLQVQNLALAIENSQLKAENAQLKTQLAHGDFDKARTAIGELLKSLQKDGYDLDLQTMTYAKKAPSAKTK
jgi:hypothetical protein